MLILQFSLQNALSSRTIAWFSAGHFSHVDAVTPSGGLLGARAEPVDGIPAGVFTRPWNYANFQRRVFLAVPSTPIQSYRFWTFLAGQIGKPYDRQAIWGFIIGRDWRETDSWICSELIAKALEYAGVIGNLYVPANKITPVSLAVAVSAAGAREIQ